MIDAWRRHRFALVLLVVLVGAVFAPALVKREVFNFRDHADYFQPLRYYTAIHIKSFLLPYWNPYSASGEPWLANPQTGVFYPPTWLFIALPFDSAYMLYLALHLLILGWGTYLLLTRWLSPGAALVGATIVTFCGPTMSLVDISNNLASFAWVPWVLWAAVSRASWQRAAVLLALTFLAGEPFFAALAAATYALVVREPKKILLTAAASFGLCAIQLLPFLELLRGSDRAARLAADQIFLESMRLSDWLRVAVPPTFVKGALDPNLSQHFIAVIYIGIPAVALAIAGIFWKPRTEDRGPRTAFLGLLGVAIVIAAGNRLPFTGDVFAHLPLTLFRYPSRLVPFGAFAIAVLAAIGWNRIRPDRRWLDLLLAGIIVADLLPREAPLFTMSPFNTNVVPYSTSIGRSAKILRMADRPITNRSAWIAGYLNLYQRRFDAATAAPVANDRYLRLHDAVLAKGRRDLTELIGAGFILSDHPIPSLQPVAVHPPVTVYLYPNTPPIATFWTKISSFATPEEALGASLEREHPGALVVSPRIDARFSSARAIVASAAFVTLDTRHARAVVDAPEDGVMMITQQDSPAWHVFVDGVEQKKLLAAGIFRAVELSKGRHEVVWRYRSTALLSGAVMTAITFALLLWSTFVKRARVQKFS